MTKSAPILLFSVWADVRSFYFWIRIILIRVVIVYLIKVHAAIWRQQFSVKFRSAKLGKFLWGLLQSSILVTELCVKNRERWRESNCFNWSKQIVPNLLRAETTMQETQLIHTSDLLSTFSTLEVHFVWVLQMCRLRCQHFQNNSRMLWLHRWYVLHFTPWLIMEVSSLLGEGLYTIQLMTQSWCSVADEYSRLINDMWTCYDKM